MGPISMWWGIPLLYHHHHHQYSDFVIVFPPFISPFFSFLLNRTAISMRLVSRWRLSYKEQG